MVKYNITCLYCDNKWTESFWSSEPTIKCLICNETKNFKLDRATNAVNDIYGYRFSPAFEVKKTVVDPDPAWSSYNNIDDPEAFEREFNKMIAEGGSID